MNNTPKKAEYVRVNTRLLSSHDAFIKKYAKDNGMYEGDVHRIAVADFVKKHDKRPR